MLLGIVGFSLACSAGAFLVARVYYAQDSTPYARLETASTADPPSTRAPSVAQAPSDPSYLPRFDELMSGAVRSESKAPHSERDIASIARRADEAYAAKDYALAATGYERALALAPDNMDLQNDLGLVLHYVGRTEEAVARLEATTKRYPGHQRTWLTLGYVHMNTGDSANARTALSQARDIDPQNTIGKAAIHYLDSLQ